MQLRPPVLLRRRLGGDVLPLRPDRRRLSGWRAARAGGGAPRRRRVRRAGSAVGGPTPLAPLHEREVEVPRIRVLVRMPRRAALLSPCKPSGRVMTATADDSVLTK